jgi:thiamine kinase-like enzyme
MLTAADPAYRQPDTEQLSAVLEGLLSERPAGPRRIMNLERRPSPYRSSFAIEELDIRFDDGTTLSLVFKNTNWESLSEVSQRAKPRFLYHPLREIETYRQILEPYSLGTAKYYGSFVDERSERFWFFVEKVSEVTLYQVGEMAVWSEAARWLAAMHRRFREENHLAEHSRNVRLLVYQSDYYKEWMKRALAFLKPDAPAESIRRLKHLKDRYDRVIECLLSLPVTFLHGEFYASNILVRTAGSEPRICPVDWELAAIGPGLIDLAALISGSWTRAQKIALALDYLTAMGTSQAPHHEAFLTALDWCSLHLAVQWLGWSLSWTPPPSQAHDWLNETFVLMDRLGL